MTGQEKEENLRAIQESYSKECNNNEVSSQQVSKDTLGYDPVLELLNNQGRSDSNNEERNSGIDFLGTDDAGNNNDIGSQQVSGDIHANWDMIENWEGYNGNGNERNDGVDFQADIASEERSSSNSDGKERNNDHIGSQQESKGTLETGAPVPVDNAVAALVQPAVSVPVAADAASNDDCNAKRRGGTSVVETSGTLKAGAHAPVDNAVACAPVPVGFSTRADVGTLNGPAVNANIQAKLTSKERGVSNSNGEERNNDGAGSQQVSGGTFDACAPVPVDNAAAALV